jgi:hypothetical protein
MTCSQDQELPRSRTLQASGSTDHQPASLQDPAITHNVARSGRHTLHFTSLVFHGTRCHDCIISIRWSGETLQGQRCKGQGAWSTATPLAHLQAALQPLPRQRQGRITAGPELEAGLVEQYQGEQY